MQLREMFWLGQTLGKGHSSVLASLVGKAQGGSSLANGKGLSWLESCRRAS